LPAVRQPPHALLRQRVRGVALRELREVALAPALRHVHAYWTSTRVAQEPLEVLALGDRIRCDDLRRERAGRGVVQTQERFDDVGGLGALRPLEREVVAADDRAVAHTEELHDRVVLGEGRREHVEVIALVRMYLLTLEGPIDGLQAIAQERGALERKRRRRRLHLLLGIARESLVASLEEQHAAIDRRAVLVLRGVTDARRGAALQVIEEARPSTGQRARW